jgi:triosephosphate isomerase
MKKFIVGNWKSNKHPQSAQQWVQEFDQAIIKPWDADVEVIVAPSFPLLPTVQWHSSITPKLANLKLCVQDISPLAAGSYTGAVSVENVQGLGVAYAIVGHSERRRYFQETHQDVANKVARCIEADITPIVCVDDEYIAGQAAAISSDYLNKCIVAYEELGAIGTGHNEPVEHVKEIVQRIKVVFNEVDVLYGGSVKPANVKNYLEISSGVLVGGASLQAKSFAEIVTAVTV